MSDYNPQCPNNYSFFADSFCFGSTEKVKIAYSTIISMFLTLEAYVAIKFYKKSKSKEELLC